MRINTIPRKLVELSRVQVTDAKARRVFILADGKRTLDNIFQLCNVDEGEGTLLINILQEAGYITLNGEDADQQQPTVSPQQTIVTDDILEHLSRELTVHLGPMAGVLVNSVVLPEHVGTREQLLDCVDMLAMKIEATQDRKRFLASIQDVI